MKMQPIDIIFSKVERDFPQKNIDKGRIIEWTGEALSAMKVNRIQEEALVFAKVKNWTLELPSNFIAVIQIVKNNLVNDPDNPPQQTDSSAVILNPKADTPVALDCNGMPIDAYDVAYYRPYFDLQYEYSLFLKSPIFKTKYSPVRLSTNSFFGSLVCTPNGDFDDLYKSSKYEYTIVNGQILKFSFEKGYVAIAYLRTPTDNNGLPLIPDDYSFITAIYKYITMKLVESEFYSGEQGAGQRYQIAVREWQWYVKQAKTKSLIPQTIDEYENLKNQMLYLIPRRNVYNNWFGNLNSREIKNILETTNRNNYGYTN